MNFRSNWREEDAKRLKEMRGGHPFTKEIAAQLRRDPVSACRLGTFLDWDDCFGNLRTVSECAKHGIPTLAPYIVGSKRWFIWHLLILKPHRSLFGRQPLLRRSDDIESVCIAEDGILCATCLFPARQLGHIPAALHVGCRGGDCCPGLTESFAVSVGTRVKLRGLTSAAGARLNGTSGTIVAAFSRESGYRCGVRLDDGGRTMAVRLQNLIRGPHDATQTDAALAELARANEISAADPTANPTPKLRSISGAGSGAIKACSMRLARARTQPFAGGVNPVEVLQRELLTGGRETAEVWSVSYTQLVGNMHMLGLSCKHRNAANDNALIRASTPCTEGVPTAAFMIAALADAMSFPTNAKTGPAHRPHAIFIAHRLKHAFAEISEAMLSLEITCRLGTKEEAKKSAAKYGTHHKGRNADFSCSACGRDETTEGVTLLKCSGCKTVHYCAGGTCQKDDWKRHKKECKNTMKKEKKKRMKKKR